MGALLPKGRVDLNCVADELLRLRRLWSGASSTSDELEGILSTDQAAALDPLDCASTCARFDPAWQQLLG